MRVFTFAFALLCWITVPAATIGSGSYEVPIQENRATKPLEIHYYAPVTLTENSRVLFVIPGAGRNAWSYRDAWIKLAEQHNVLILSPHYSERDYPEFWNYNLGNMIKNVKFDDDGSAIASYDFVGEKTSWIFDDFDFIFEDAKRRFAVTTATYDMFGHSAGGQILHRLALFSSDSKASRLIAANSGWYTLPLLDLQFPYGLQGTGLTADELRRSFGSSLIVFLGERDDESETRGSLARNASLDQQGKSRIARGQYFFQRSCAAAHAMDVDLKWQLKIVPNVGHDYIQMSEAAAQLLYGSKSNANAKCKPLGTL